VGTGSRIINPLYAFILNIAPQHRFKEYSMAVVAYLTPPVFGAGLQGVDEKTFARRATEYVQVYPFRCLRPWGRDAVASERACPGEFVA
jgi:hypothetical protein